MATFRVGSGAWLAACVVVALATDAGSSVAEERLQVAQATADPVIAQAVRDLDIYEELVNRMAPGDTATGRQYRDGLATVGRRLSGVADKNQPGWREAADRFNTLQKRIASIANQRPAPGAPPAAEGKAK